ncbi:MAG TPA: hypothetical protein VIC53_08995 [Wenzhouxiangella sp.]
MPDMVLPVPFAAPIGTIVPDGSVALVLPPPRKMDPPPVIWPVEPLAELIPALLLISMPPAMPSAELDHRMMSPLLVWSFLLAAKVILSVPFSKRSAPLAVEVKLSLMVIFFAYTVMGPAEVIFPMAIS